MFYNINMKFADSWLYLITLGVLLISFTFIMIFKRVEFIEVLKKHKVILTRITGASMIALMIWYIGYFIWKGGYHHLLFGDMCAFTALLAGPFLLSGNRTLIRSISPWMFIGGLLTMVSSAPDFVEDGIPAGIISYAKHTLMFVAASCFLLASSRYEKKDYLYVFLYIAIFLVWLILTTGIAYWVTGEDRWGIYSTALLKPSYKKHMIIDGKDYSGSYSFLSDMGMPYPVPTIIFYFLAVGLSMGVSWTLPTIGNKIINSKEKSHP